MTNAKFASLIRYQTSTNSTTFTDADILLLTNTYKDELCALLAKEVGEDYFGLRFERNLVAGQREYELPGEIMGRIKRLEAKLNGTDWKVLHETDLAEFDEATDEATITAAYSGRNAEFDMWDRSVFILSDATISAVTNGLILWAIIFPADITDLSLTTDLSVDLTDTSHGIPRQLHELLARRVSIAWKENQDRPIPLTEKEQNFDKDLSLAILTMKGANESRVTAPACPYNDGSQY